MCACLDRRGKGGLYVPPPAISITQILYTNSASRTYTGRHGNCNSIKAIVTLKSSFVIAVRRSDSNTGLVPVCCGDIKKT